MDPNEIKVGDVIPLFEKKNHLIYALGISTIQEIVTNARQQKANSTADDLFEAFLHYNNNDDVGGKSPISLLEVAECTKYGLRTTFAHRNDPCNGENNPFFVHFAKT